MKNQGSILVLVALIIVLLGGAFIYLKSNLTYTAKPSQNYSQSPQPTQKTSTSSPTQSKNYISKGMSLNIEVPSNFEIQDQSIRILLNSSSGQVVITRSGTQFDDLNSYLADLDSKNHVQIISQQDLNIDSYPTKKRRITIQSGSENVYEILVNSRIYTFSTSSEALYDDLDQIAHSFRYTP